MYAIIKTGSKQYRVKAGDTLHVELLGEHAEGSIELGEVLMWSDGDNSIVGTPTVAGCVVIAEIGDIVKGPKVRSMTYKKRCNQRRRIGHRQKMHRVTIKEIKTIKEKTKKA
jgi:large subunit ribosomal protein L21